MNRLNSTGDSPFFPKTHWSWVLAANDPGAPQSEAALESLCRAYWYPLYSFVRRSGQSPQDAEDITQAFFYSLVEKRWLAPVRPAKGRLRTFLIVILRRFMNNEWRRASARRRGDGRRPVPFDTALAESGVASVAGRERTPDEVFDYQWAVTLLNRTMDQLRSEFAGAGREATFATLKECLATAQSVDYHAVALRLGVTDGAARIAAHRLRRRFREIFREEVSQTLSNPGELDDEMRHLAAVLARR